jgi:hypothetical protein
MRARTLALLVLLPALAACNGSSGPSGTATPLPRVTHTVVTTQPPLPLPTIEGNPVLFRTADGNVGCDLEPAFVICNIGTKSFVSPRKPGDCLYSWGKEVEVAAGSPGEFICGHNENYRGSKRVLPLGQALKVGLVTCRAVAGGVQCTSEANGFLLTRTKYRVF